MQAIGPYVPTLIIALVFAVVRFRVPSVKPDFSPTGIVKVLAHIFVGGLAGYSYGAADWIPAIIAGLLTAVEMLAFVVKQEAKG